MNFNCNLRFERSRKRVFKEHMSVTVGFGVGNGQFAFTPDLNYNVTISFLNVLKSIATSGNTE